MNFQLFKKLHILLGRVHIPEALNNTNPKLLHLSDTPRLFYPEIRRLIHKIDPEIIIHTGDCADNIKLALQPGKLDLYAHAMGKLKKNLADAKRLIICLGNHDDLTLLEMNFPSAEIVVDQAIIHHEDLKFFVSHYGPKSIERDVDFYLYGHSPEPTSQYAAPPYFLNGMDAIYVVDLHTHEIIILDYPSDLKAYRMNLYKTGL